MAITRGSLLGMALGACAEGRETGSEHDAAFREGRFPEALSLAERALAANAKDAAALLTRVRVHDASYYGGLAESEYQAALAVDREAALAALPDLSFAEKRPDLIEQYLKRPVKDKLGYERLRGLKVWLEAAGGRRLCAVEGAVPAGRHTAAMLKPSATSPGLMALSVSVNGHRPLNLLFSSTAFGLWISPGKAQSLDLAPLDKGWISEPGLSDERRGRYALAGRIDVGGLAVRDVPVFLGGLNAYDADGVIGISTLREVLLKLYPWAPAVAYEPIPPVPAVPAGARPCARSRHLILLPSNMESKGGLMLLHLQAEEIIADRPIRQGYHPPLGGTTGYSCTATQVFSHENVVLDLGQGPEQVVVRDCSLAATSKKVRLRIRGVLGLSYFQARMLALDQVRGIAAFT